MEKKEQLYEGKAKKVFATDDPDLCIVSYKDDATAFNGKKKGTIVGKGVVNNKMSNFMFKMLEKDGIPTHFVQELSDRDTLVKKVQIVPLEVIIRNVAAGSFSKRLGVEEGTVLKCPVLEFCYKSDPLDDPMVNDSHVLAMGWATEEEVSTIKKMALRVNELMKAFFLSVNIDLIDFKLEFGRFQGQILLADEISPDTCRFWDVKTHDKLDKDRFRRDLGGVEEAYAEVMKRIGL
ncbi:MULTISPECIES: phosphoribosylaminoimidazolesuccinocarboxamide synthase [Caproicibacterium]|uniref:Phosphoribosylaminoimidazole-succinocarboxamide synthase n=1 Tax=Caproicibacterium argilliputei TaxID=3030016 RepID=A0AA97DAJ0_9FIRM|nr:phosphoribosylaminoimidazolesuccinocarboxamide synthase [Caproicibacterium argilliputei]WOC33341.1 phosphoribosylaminoimidazolesuccinocarboxamide synthase [Caproicibacterium argilliputei]